MFLRTCHLILDSRDSSTYPCALQATVSEEMTSTQLSSSKHREEWPLTGTAGGRGAGQVAAAGL